MRKSIFFIGAISFLFSCGQDPGKRPRFDDSVNGSEDVERVFTGQYEGKAVTLVVEAITVKELHEAVDRTSWRLPMEPQDSGKYYFQRDSTLFVLLVGDTSVYVSHTHTDNDDFESYEPPARVGTSDFYFLSVGRYEGESEYFLIDRTTGIETPAREIPLLSPNGKLLYLCTPGTELYGPGARVQLFRIEGSDLVELFDEEIEDWSPADEKWVNDSTLVMRQTSYTYPGENLPDRYARMIVR